MSTDYEEHQHQRIMRQLEVIKEMQEKLAKYRAALLLIGEWELPYKRFGFENGSNGERDYFRKIAIEATK